MTEQTNPSEQKSRLLNVFRTIASTYDALHFLQDTARRLIELANIQPATRVLDVATGTGIVALACAEIVGEAGRVVGIDLSPDMLEQARRKLEGTGLKNVEFREGDAMKLDFPDGSFNVALCASSLFFIPDMVSVLKECRRVLAPNGIVGFNSFQPSFLQPYRELWSARLQKHDLKIGSLPIHRLADVAMCEGVLREAGFDRIDARVEQLGYYQTVEERWSDITMGLEGMPILKLSKEQREQIKAEHIAELKKGSTEKGIWVDVPPIFAFGR